MFDFVRIKTSTKLPGKRGEQSSIKIYPEFIVGPSEDLMIRGNRFYAVWDEKAGFWSSDPSRVVDIIDSELAAKAKELGEQTGSDIDVLYLRNFSSKKWLEFTNYCNSLPDNYVELDANLTFSNQEVSKDDHVSKKLPYPLKAGCIDAYEELMTTLYDPIEKQKLEWAVGSIVAGDSVRIQKFVVLYGSSGTGKSTFLSIVQRLFDGYYNIFEAKALTGNNNNFAMEMFRDNPLVSIQHDGDLSRIEDNTKLNSIVSHEEIVVNERYKHTYISCFRTFLFMGTNTPVKITDAKSGILRRLIDVRPTGNLVPVQRYLALDAQINFELGAIAYHCMQEYLKLGPNAYDSYRPTEMMGATNDFYNFIEDHYDIFSSENGTSLTEAWTLYKNWADEAAVPYQLSKRALKEELKSYFKEFRERAHMPDGSFHRNWYCGFDKGKFSYSSEFKAKQPVQPSSTLTLNSRESIFDKKMSDAPAQYASAEGIPAKKWDGVKTTLKDIDTHELHYVKVPENHIVIDFDLKDENGEKSLELNMQAASKWPTTYAELSKSQKGVHLHYIWDGDPRELAPEYKPGIEIKVFKGNSALRRKLSRCNDSPIVTLSAGLPLKKGDSKVIDFDGLKNEKSLRTVIERNLKKEYHASTKQSIDFIHKALEDAYNGGLHYDVTDMRPAVLAFAANSTNQSLYCIKKVNSMQFHSEDAGEGVEWSNDTIIFYDVEVFPNLFVVVWKAHGDSNPVQLINPTPTEIEDLCRFKLVGFNCRRYDNHILYARMQGYSNEQLYKLSKAMISRSSRNATFREAYGLSYADVWDYNDNKQSLKKWEIQLGIHHQELGLDWNEPVPEELWQKVADYCINDVVATEAVFDATQPAFNARCMLAELSGLRINDSTRMHVTRIIFGKDRNPQTQFNYVHLDEMFPGYEFDAGVSHYKGEIVGEGGYVYAEPGYYENVALLDVASMHPTSLIAMNMFGDKYTKRFAEIKDARVAIKHGDFEKAGTMLDGKLKPYLGNPEDAGKLAFALKIVINSVYGLTSATFDCEFKDKRNVDNIVAKRGALFMINLKEQVQKRGFTVAHIKTDSIKIPNATPEIVQFVIEYGKEYGYTFEHEHTYKRMCLVNDAVYIAQLEDGSWSPTGKQFAVPYVYKTLFSGEDLEFKDFCETFSTSKGDALYLDLNESDPVEHHYAFVGKVGLFTPVKPSSGGGILVAKFTNEDEPDAEPRYSAPSGSKGYRWLESEQVMELNKQDRVDLTYYEQLAAEARETISQFVEYDHLVRKEQ